MTVVHATMPRLTLTSELARLMQSAQSSMIRWLKTSLGLALLSRLRSATGVTWIIDTRKSPALDWYARFCGTILPNRV